MNKCENCGAPLKSVKGAKYCPYCGEKIPDAVDSEFELNKLKAEQEAKYDRILLIGIIALVAFVLIITAIHTF